MNILIADDEKEYIDFMTERLTIRGHEVDAAYDGEKAMYLIKTNDYDIVFVDQNMTGWTGLELAKYIKDNKVKTAVVMVTGYEGMEDFFAKAVGVDEYLTKPVKIKDVDDIVAKHDKR